MNLVEEIPRSSRGPISGAAPWLGETFRNTEGDAAFLHATPSDTLTVEGTESMGRLPSAELDSGVAVRGRVLNLVKGGHASMERDPSRRSWQSDARGYAVLVDGRREGLKTNREKRAHECEPPQASR